MAALTIAKDNLVKGMAPMEGLLKDLLDREFITQDIYDRIKADEDLAHHFKPKPKAKAKSPTKKATKKISGDLKERNDEKFSGDRCFARKWEAEGGLGYDSIQCSSCKKVTSDEAEKVMDGFKDKMDEDQLARLPEYLEKYDSCFCKNHLKQDFFMPNGWWLGKVNEDRPEKPMLPKGSFKDGYHPEDCKEHRWMFDGDGHKNERVSNRGRTPKKEMIEDDDVEQPEEKVEEPEEKVEEPEEKVEEPEEKVEEKEEKVEEKEDDHEDRPYIVDNVEYTEVWDEDDKEWLVTLEEDHIGWSEDGGIRFADDDEEKAHAKRVEKLVPKEEEDKEEEEEDKEEEEEDKEEDQLLETVPPSDEVIEEKKEDHEDRPYIVDGVEYTESWDEDDNEWLVTLDDEHVGWSDDGGIRFADDDEEKAHAERVEELE